VNLPFQSFSKYKEGFLNHFNVSYCKSSILRYVSIMDTRLFYQLPYYICYLAGWGTKAGKKPVRNYDCLSVIRVLSFLMIFEFL
jgi:hypothetical protein